MDAITALPSTLSLGEVQHAGRLTMVPLLRREPARILYVTFGEALRRNLVEITEVSEGGSVPEVRVLNLGDRPVLFLDGDALVGAKQNRVLNLTVLLAAHSTTLLPVSCVEAGRWSSHGRHFCEGDSLHFAGARAAKMSSVSDSMASGGARRSNQSDVWRVMASYGSRFAAEAPSGAMQDILDSVRTPVEELLERLALVPDQCGAAFVVDGHLVGLDILSSAEAFAGTFAKVVRSYAVEAQVRLHQSSPLRNPERRAQALVYDLFAALVDGRWREHRGVGLGTDLRLSNSGVNAGALVLEEEVIHLAAFPCRNPPDYPGDDFPGPMPRRHGRGNP